jgi:hypothetical protein
VVIPEKLLISNKKMARKKETKIKAFKVTKGDIAYDIVEKLESKKCDFSKIMREALIFYFINKEEFKQAKIEGLLTKRKELKDKIPEISKELQTNEKLLNKLGYKLGYLD